MELIQRKHSQKMMIQVNLFLPHVEADMEASISKLPMEVIIFL